MSCLVLPSAPDVPNLFAKRISLNLTVKVQSALVTALDLAILRRFHSVARVLGEFPSPIHVACCHAVMLCRQLVR